MTTQTATPATKPHLSASVTIFNFILKNPYMLFADVKEAVVAQGFLESTVETLIYKMLRVGMVSRDMDGKLTALQKKYTSVSAAYTRARGKAKVVAVRGKDKKPRVQPPRKEPSQGIAALTPNATPNATLPLTAARVLEMLSIKEAHVLYRELQSMFGA